MHSNQIEYQWVNVWIEGAIMEWQLGKGKRFDDAGGEMAVASRGLTVAQLPPRPCPTLGAAAAARQMLSPVKRRSSRNTYTQG